MKITDWIDPKWLSWRGLAVLAAAGAGVFLLTKLMMWVLAQA